MPDSIRKSQVGSNNRRTIILPATCLSQEASSLPPRLALYYPASEAWLVDRWRCIEDHYLVEIRTDYLGIWAAVVQPLVSSVLTIKDSRVNSRCEILPMAFVV